MTGSPWQQLRFLEPPLGAKRRVLAAVEAQLEASPKHSKRWLVLTLPVVSAAAVLLLWGARSDRPSEAARPILMSGASAPVHDAGIPLPSDAGIAQLHVPDNDEVSVELKAATVAIRGPASVRVERRRLSVTHGTLRIQGRAVVSAPQCEARVSGQAEIAVADNTMQVSVFAGHAEFAVNATTCTILDLSQKPLAPTSSSAPQQRPDTPPRTQRQRTRQAAAVDARTSKPLSPQSDRNPPETRAETQADRGRVNTDAPLSGAPSRVASVRRPSAPSRSQLRQQVHEFKRARELHKQGDPSVALAAWRALVRKWPTSPLRPEAEAAIIEVLRRLGQVRTARLRAREFVRRYPASPQSRRLNRWLAESAR